jgi:hypothetical protein
VENENTVWGNSGRALSNIEQTINPHAFDSIRKRIADGHIGLPSMSAIDNYYARPSHISEPRHVRLGASIIF